MSLLNVTEGALNEQSSILIRLRELASQAATGTVGSTERATIQLEFSALRDELTRIAQTTEFNGIGLIDGTLASSVATATQTLVSASGAVTTVATTSEAWIAAAASGAVTTTVATTDHTMIQIGIDNSANSRIDLNNSLALDAVTSSTLGIASLSVTAAAEALTALAQIEDRNRISNRNAR